MFKERARKTCCVPGCQEILKKHRFPLNNLQLFEEWKIKIRNPRFFDLSNEQIYKSYVVCEKHFTDEDKVVSKRGLRKYAIPNLYLSDNVDDNDGPCIHKKFKDACDHDYCSTKLSPYNNENVCMSMNSINLLKKQKDIVYEHNYCSTNKPNTVQNEKILTEDVITSSLGSTDITDENKLEKRACEMGEFLLFMDKLFDSVNGNHKIAPRSKPLKGGVTATSQHIAFWNETIQTLETMKFYSEKKNSFIPNPSIKNLIFTFKGFIYLIKILLSKKKFQYILMRVFNQDALENFCCCIRSHGIRNTSPNSHHFMLSFKSLIITNFLSTHSPGANCEEDECNEALDNLRCFLTGQELAGIEPIDKEKFVMPNIPQDICANKKTRVARCTIQYFTGYLLKKIDKYLQTCKMCKNNFYFRDNLLDLDVIEL